jgi:hypothetical protein
LKTRKLKSQLLQKELKKKEERKKTTLAALMQNFDFHSLQTLDVQKLKTGCI